MMNAVIAMTMSGSVRFLWVGLFLALSLASCHPKSCVLEPNIQYFATENQFQTFPSAFPPLLKNELAEDWGKELMIGIRFGRSLDLYRAITAFKRAQFLAPRELVLRRQQIAYGILLAYYLGHKYQEAVETFEKSELSEVTSQFPAMEDLVLILYDSYYKTNQLSKADKLMELIEKSSSPVAKDLKLSNAIQKGDFKEICAFSPYDERQPFIDGFLQSYQSQKKSVRKAQVLNAVLPGAGYYYVGQKKAAVTSFVINALFTWAAYSFFEQNQIAAGLITTSFEMGWYLGGINGAGLEAKYYNERLYNEIGKEAMISTSLFPVIMLQKSF